MIQLKAHVLQGLGCDDHLHGHCLTIDVAKLPAGSAQGPALQIAALQQLKRSPDSLFIIQGADALTASGLSVMLQLLGMPLPHLHCILVV